MSHCFEEYGLAIKKTLVVEACALKNLNSWTGDVVPVRWSLSALINAYSTVFFSHNKTASARNHLANRVVDSIYF
jgi:hypothetical protein